MSKKVRFPACIERVILHAVEGNQRVELNLENGVGEIFSDATVDLLVKEGIKEYTGPTEEEARLLAEGKRPLAPGQAAPASAPNTPNTDLSNPKPGNQPKPVTPEMIRQENVAREARRTRLGTEEKVPEGPATAADLEARFKQNQASIEEQEKQRKTLSDKAAADVNKRPTTPPMQTSRQP